MLDIAIAFCTFNRPDVTAKTFEGIREARPTRLFLISDAARDGRHDEAALVTETRNLIEHVDWDCDVQKIYADANMGCGPRISSGITTAFESVDRLIILEDDCVPDPSFFSYCQSVLERYEDDERVMAVSGDNFQCGISRTDASYYFSKYMHCWGWATWRRAWNRYSFELDGWPEFRDTGGLNKWCDDELEVQFWTEIFDRCHRKEITTWDYPWLLCCWMNGGLSVIPDINLVSNIGFGAEATHTTKPSPFANLPVGSLNEIVHPAAVNRQEEADQFTDKQMFSRAQRVSFLKRLRRKLGLSRRAA